MHKWRVWSRLDWAPKLNKLNQLTEVEEDILWKKSIIGDHSPQALLNAVFFLNSICFALMSGLEHRQLRLKDCQIHVVQKHGEKAYLHYKEDCSKNNSGGLKSRNLKLKEVLHYKNTDNPRARGPCSIVQAVSEQMSAAVERRWILSQASPEFSWQHLVFACSTRA